MDFWFYSCLVVEKEIFKEVMYFYYLISNFYFNIMFYGFLYILSGGCLIYLNNVLSLLNVDKNIFNSCINIFDFLLIFIVFGDIGNVYYKFFFCRYYIWLG